MRSHPWLRRVLLPSRGCYSKFSVKLQTSTTTKSTLANLKFEVNYHPIVFQWLEAFYTARMNRPDIYYAVNVFAREVVRWNKMCDRRLHKLMCYMHHTSQLVFTCFLGDQIPSLKLALYSDFLSPTICKIANHAAEQFLFWSVFVLMFR